MPRRPRQEAPGALHHVVVQAATGGRLVLDDLDRIQFLDEFAGVVRASEWECIAYGVLDGHAHFVLCTPQPNLGEGMRRFQGRYASLHNRRHGRRGHLFGGRYWSRRIDRPHYLRCAAVYAVLNVVAAGICAHPSQFAWCSYRETAGVPPPGSFLAPDILLRTFDQDLARARVVYRELVDEAVVRLSRRRREVAWSQEVERVVAVARTTD